MAPMKEKGPASVYVIHAWQVSGRGPKRYRRGLHGCAHGLGAQLTG